MGCFVAGGYILTNEEGHAWVKSTGKEFDPEFTAWSLLLAEIFKIYGLAEDKVRCIDVKWPKPIYTERHKLIYPGRIICFIHRHGYRQQGSTIHHYREIKQDASDIKIGEFLQKKGLNLRWVTIPDPYNQEYTIVRPRRRHQKKCEVEGTAASATRSEAGPLDSLAEEGSSPIF
jgi:hypothetical protein